MTGSWKPGVAVLAQLAKGVGLTLEGLIRGRVDGPKVSDRSDYRWVRVRSLTRTTLPFLASGVVSRCGRQGFPVQMPPPFGSGAQVSGGHA